MNAFKDEVLTYDWIHGGEVKYSRYDYPITEELRDDEGQVVPGCFITMPCADPDEL